MNGLVEAALRVRSSGQFPDPPYPPPRRIARPPRAEGLTLRPAGDPLSADWVINQHHPDFDWGAALHYCAITGGWAGRSIVEVTAGAEFDRSIFGAHPSAFNDALVALEALSAWCRAVSLPPIFEVFSPANAERFISDGLKSGLKRRTLDNRRGIYAKLWDRWAARRAAFLEKTPHEPIENPWRQPEISPAAVSKKLERFKARKARARTSPAVVSPARLDALAKGRERLALRVNEHHARIDRRVKGLKAKGVTSQTGLAAELNKQKALGRCDGLQDATSLRRHLKRTSKWPRKGDARTL